MNQEGKWRTVNTPRWQALFKDLRMRKSHTESMHIQLHGTDLAHLPFAGKLKWLVEFPPACLCLLLVSPLCSSAFCALAGPPQAVLCFEVF